MASFPTKIKPIGLKLHGDNHDGLVGDQQSFNRALLGKYLKSGPRQPPLIITAASSRAIMTG
jgi:hypothetical protein